MVWQCRDDLLTPVYERHLAEIDITESELCSGPMHHKVVGVAGAPAWNLQV